MAKPIGEGTFPMPSYNRSIPGPMLRVGQGSEILVNVANETQMETTVHWHGLRLENRYDGVPHETQSPIPPGGRYTHRLSFPDAGLYWYHPHIREDFAQELGLYGNTIVPAVPSYWPPADREVTLTLDDILIEDGKVAAFDQHGPNYMSRVSSEMTARREQVMRHLDAPADRTLVLVAEMDLGEPGARPNPGRWMAHCHIAEHMESGMMFSFDVHRAA